MKKVSAIIIVFLVIAIGASAYYFLKKPAETTSNKSLPPSATIKENTEPQYHNRFASFATPSINTTRTTKKTLPENYASVKEFSLIPKSKNAQKIFKKNGFVVMPTDYLNPFQIYTQREDSAAHLITTDLVFTSYLSLFQSIKEETIKGTLLTKMLSFLNASLEVSPPLQKDLRNTFVAAITLSGNEPSPSIEYNQREIDTIVSNFEEHISKDLIPAQKMWLFLSTMSLQNGNENILKTFLQNLENDTKRKKSFFEIYDTWLFFNGTETHPDLYDTNTESQPKTLLSSTPYIETLFQNTTDPRVSNRKKSKALDSLAILGNNPAQEILSNEGDTKVYPKYAQALNEQAHIIDTQSGDFWLHSYNTQLLRLFSLEIDPSYAFMSSGAYSQKHLNTLLSAQAIVLNTTPRTPTDKSIMSFSEKETLLETHPNAYAYLGAIAQQIHDGLSNRGLLIPSHEQKLNKAIALSKILSQNTSISNDTISSLEELYSPEYSQGIISQINSTSQSPQSALGFAHEIYAYVNANGKEHIARGFVFAHYILNNEQGLSASAWKRALENNELPTYSLWNKTFLGIE